MMQHCSGRPLPGVFWDLPWLTWVGKDTHCNVVRFGWQVSEHILQNSAPNCRHFRSDQDWHIITLSSSQKAASNTLHCVNHRSNQAHKHASGIKLDSNWLWRDQDLYLHLCRRNIQIKRHTIEMLQLSPRTGPKIVQRRIIAWKTSIAVPSDFTNKSPSENTTNRNLKCCFAIDHRFLKVQSYVVVHMVATLVISDMFYLLGSWKVSGVGRRALECGGAPNSHPPTPSPTFRWSLPSCGW